MSYTDMREFTDWRYRLVWAVDALLHKLTGNGERGPLCNLERRMYWRRKDQKCCCDAQNVVQPCGPCRCDDHAECAG